MACKILFCRKPHCWSSSPPEFKGGRSGWGTRDDGKESTYLVWLTKESMGYADMAIEKNVNRSRRSGSSENYYWNGLSRRTSVVDWGRRGSMCWYLKGKKKKEEKVGYFWKKKSWKYIRKAIPLIWEWNDDSPKLGEWAFKWKGFSNLYFVNQTLELGPFLRIAFPFHSITPNQTWPWWLIGVLIKIP